MLQPLQANVGRNKIQTESKKNQFITWVLDKYFLVTHFFLPVMSVVYSVVYSMVCFVCTGIDYVGSKSGPEVKGGC